LTTVVETNVRKCVLELLQPVLNKITIEKESLSNTKRYIGDQTKRIENLEAAVFEQEADDQFNEIRKKITNIEKIRKEKESDLEAVLQVQRKDFDHVLFQFKNLTTEFNGLNATISTVKEHFKTLEHKMIEEFQDANQEISQCNKNVSSSFEKLNDRQSELDEVLNERFKQLDVQNVKINKVEAIIESYREEVNQLKNLCQQLQNTKTNLTTFDEHCEQVHEIIRKIKVDHDTLKDSSTNIENF